MIRLNLFMIWFLHFLSLLSVICMYYRQNSPSRIIVVLVYTVSTHFRMYKSKLLTVRTGAIGHNYVNLWKNRNLFLLTKYVVGRN